ncbi:hypothetical protein B296_00028167 [Ensete ventricosum]|uniref:Uncharacterized protein n=1 Tax=Ensete ventricosum TaxID=4639 RepID=A0A426Y1V0_ENSVE|nr:hypothetical protein B296_00028167 [Ensete ventricosum]
MYLRGCFGGRSLVSPSSHHRGMYQMVEDFPESGSAQLVALPCCVFELMPRDWDYPDSKLVHGILSLLKSRGSYYLTAHVGFRVSGSPSNNKGWKSRYLFMSGPNWGFRLDWLAHPIGNVLPYLSKEESVLVDKLKGILSSSCAIKEMIELWQVEAGLSPASRGIISFTLILNLRDVFLTCGSRCRPDGSQRSSWNVEGVGGTDSHSAFKRTNSRGRGGSTDRSSEVFIKEAICCVDPT